MIPVVDVENRQRMSTPFTEFDVGYNERINDSVEFDADTVDFCFQAPMFSEKLRCHVLPRQEAVQSVVAHVIRVDREAAYYV